MCVCFVLADHGVFVPLALVYPEADIPVVQVSLKSNLDAAEHVRIGQALAPLRGEGILIIGAHTRTHTHTHMRRHGNAHSHTHSP